MTTYRITIRPLLRILAVLLLAAALAALMPVPGQAASANGILRVGLYYGSSAMATANLANEVGSGYRFGYFDSDRSFVEVGTTTEDHITICKDTNLYYASGSYYETRTSSSYQLVGAYHLQTNQTYATYAEAAAAAQNYPYGFPAYINGAYRVRFEFYSTEANAAADAANYSGVTVVGNSTSCYTVVITGTNTILFEYDGGAGGNYLGIMPDVTGVAAPQTWFRGYCYYGGFQYCRRTGDDLTIINYVDVDDYVKGVVPYEMSASWPLETLKAGAVAARTFAEATSKHTTYGFDVCATTDCQVYRGVYTGSYASNIERAAEETAGECIYYNGRLIEALYHSADGGATEDAANAWGSSYAYLIGKEDPYEQSISIPSDEWSYSMSGSELAEVLQEWSSSYASCSDIVSVEITEYTAMGNVNEIVLTDSNGRTYTFTGDDTRGIFQNYFPNGYFSRRYIVLAPGESYTGSSTTGSTSSVSGSFYVTDGTSVSQADSIYAITASGTELLSGSASVISGSGSVSSGSAQTGSGSASGFDSVTNTSSTEWLIVGSGYGHNIGMSQYGAYAMGLQGYTYEEILTFYYTGVTIS